MKGEGVSQESKANGVNMVRGGEGGMFWPNEGLGGLGAPGLSGQTFMSTLFSLC